MSLGESWGLLTGNWFVMVLLGVHAVMLLGFFFFIVRPNTRAGRVALTVSLFGICGGMIALASGRELVTMFAGLF
ncbi:MAG TPA: hypothetical protein VD902_02855 [Symbiobacteriaceae bacterium]|nr:hypothetical protein [Symbiobacteriaceae bacterium]